MTHRPNSSKTKVTGKRVNKCRLNTRIQRYFILEEPEFNITPTMPVFISYKTVSIKRKTLQNPRIIKSLL